MLSVSFTSSWAVAHGGGAGPVWPGVAAAPPVVVVGEVDPPPAGPVVEEPAAAGPVVEGSDGADVAGPAASAADVSSAVPDPDRQEPSASAVRTVATTRAGTVTARRLAVSRDH